MHSFRALCISLLVSLLISSCHGQGNSLKRVLILDIPPNSAVASLTAGDPPLPTGTSLALDHSPDGDLIMYLGDGLTADLTDRIITDCGKDDNDCENSVQAGIMDAGYNIQARAIGIVTAIGGLLLASLTHLLLMMWASTHIVPNKVIMPAPDVSSITAATAATELIFKTASDDPGEVLPITQVSSSPASVPAGTITTTIDPSTITVTPIAVKSIAAGYEVDFLPAGSTELAWLQAQAKAPCLRQSKRQLGGCAVPNAQIAMVSLAGPLVNLVTITNTLPRLARAAQGGDLYNTIQSIFNTGRQIAALARVSDDTLWTLAEIFLELFGETISIASTNTLPASDFATATAVSLSITSNSQSRSCPTGSAAPACPDADCSGVQTGMRTCTVSGTLSGCSCAPLVTPYVYTANTSWLDLQQSILGSMMKLGPLPMSIKLNCSSDGAPWYSPTAWCNCGVYAKFPTIAAPSGSPATDVCGYSGLPPSTIVPVSVGQGPTNVPGLNGLPGCAMVLSGYGQACPGANYCNCGGTAVKPITTVISGTTTSNCAVTIQPTANDCPAPSTTATLSTPSPTLQCNPTTGGGYQLFDRTIALNQITKLCTDFKSNKLVLGPGGVNLPPPSLLAEGQIAGAAANGATLGINPNYAKAACPDPANPVTVDFGTMSVSDCIGYFMTAVDSCPSFTNPSGAQYWKIGGQNRAACAFWNVQAT